MYVWPRAALLTIEFIQSNCINKFSFLFFSLQNFGIIEPIINNKESANNMSLLKFFAIVSIRQYFILSFCFDLLCVKISLCSRETWRMTWQRFKMSYGIDKIHLLRENSSPYRSRPNNIHIPTRFISCGQRHCGPFKKKKKAKKRINRLCCVRVTLSNSC